jgi:hypothetical protein
VTELTANPTPHPTDFATTLHVDRARLFAELDARGIAQAVITFNGCGDEGQIEQITFDDVESADIDARGSAEIPPHPDGMPVASLQILEAWLEDFVYDAIGSHFPGWQDNDGAYGEITLEAATRTVTLDFNARFTDAHNSVIKL